MREWISGRNPVYEVFQARRRHVFKLKTASGVQEKGRLQEILALAQKAKVPIERVPRAQLDILGDNPQGVAAETSAYPYAALDDLLTIARRRNEPPFILILDQIQNPQNLGALIRTAEAAGVHGIVIPLARAVEVTPAVVSASAGATEHLLVAQANLAQSIVRLKEAGVWVIGLEGSPSSQPPEKVRLDGPLALVVGNEGEGLRPLVRQSCDLLLSLPMKGKIESLNAAVAGSIALYLALSARQKALEKPDEN